MLKKNVPLGAIDEHARTVKVLASTPNAVDGEALESWDLSRFEKNPAVLWAHDATKMVVGRASDMADADGLTMTVHFAPDTVNPFAEELWQAVRLKFIRTLSVGYDEGEGEKDANGVVVRRLNKLYEVSFVPVPADEDALVDGKGAAVEASEQDESAAAEPPKMSPASVAASALAKHRHSLKKLDAKDNYRGKLDRGGRLDKFETTQLGGKRMPARLCRVGVLEYRDPSRPGGIRRELRLPEEVFHPDSLASLRSAPVIEIGDHTRLHSATNYRDVALGHTENVKADGQQYVEAELVIQDANTLDRIERGELKDISCGYVSRDEESPGFWNGQPYDVIQRNIRYNHVALCPPNRGRAGPAVGLRLDANNDAPAWSVEEIDMVKIKLDGKEYEYGSEAHIAKLEEMAAAKLAEVTKERDTLQGKLDAKETAAKKSADEAKEAKEKEADEKKKEASRTRAACRSAVRLYRKFRKAVARDDEDEDTDEDGEKMDAADGDSKEDMLIDECFEKPREVMLRALKKDEPNFKADGKSDDYVEARFDALVERMAERTSVDDVVHAVENAKDEQSKLDAKDQVTDATDVVGQARAAYHDRMRNAHKTPAQGSNGATK